MKATLLTGCGNSTQKGKDFKVSEKAQLVPALGEVLIEVVDDFFALLQQHSKSGNLGDLGV